MTEITLDKIKKVVDLTKDAKSLAESDFLLLQFFYKALLKNGVSVKSIEYAENKKTLMLRNVNKAIKVIFNDNSELIIIMRNRRK